MIVRQAITTLAIALFVTPALAAPVASPVPVRERVIAVQDKAEKKGEEHGKKQAKGKAKHEDDKKDARSNKGGATRGGERSDQVQGMQDTGKGPAKRQ
jgi:hypothetical protein